MGGGRAQRFPFPWKHESLEKPTASFPRCVGIGVVFGSTYVSVGGTGRVCGQQQAGQPSRRQQASAKHGCSRPALRPLFAALLLCMKNGEFEDVAAIDAMVEGER